MASVSRSRMPSKWSRSTGASPPATRGLTGGPAGSRSRPTGTNSRSAATRAATARSPAALTPENARPVPKGRSCGRPSGATGARRGTTSGSRIPMPSGATRSSPVSTSTTSRSQPTSRSRRWARPDRTRRACSCAQPTRASRRTNSTRVCSRSTTPPCLPCCGSWRTTATASRTSRGRAPPAESRSRSPRPPSTRSARAVGGEISCELSADEDCAGVEASVAGRDARFERGAVGLRTYRTASFYRRILVWTP